MRFQTKKELLRYLGKNEDDRKLVDRMVARGEVRLEGRIYVLEEKEEAVSKTSFDLANRLSSLSNDLEYLNKEYEKLEGLLDYSLRKCYDIMRKRGLISSDDTYDNFYENITGGYNDNEVHNISERSESDRSVSDTERGKADLNADLKEVLKKFNLGYAS